MTHEQPGLEARAREIKLIDPSYPSYPPSAADLAEDLRVNATFEELTAVVVRPVKTRYVKPPRKPREPARRSG